MASQPPPLRISIRTRFLITAMALVLLFVISVSNAVNVLHDVLTMMESNLEEHIDELAPILALEQLVYRTERTIYLYIASPEPEEVNQYMQLGEAVDGAFLKLRQAPFGVAEERRAVSEAQQQWLRGRELADRLFSTDTQAVAMDSVAINELRARLDGMIGSLDRMRQVAQQELQERVSASEQAVQHAHRVTLLLVAISGAMTSVIGVIFLHSVFGRLEQLEAGTMRLAEGDLTTRVEVDGADELGRFGEAFNTMAERLQKSQYELKSQATRDSLTGLHNHAEFERLLEDELSRSRRYHHPLSLLLLDVDHFKEINDRLGHLNGDKVLRHLAEVLLQESRPADHVARYGGEEFVVILPEINHAGAMVTAERIRSAVAGRSLTLESGENTFLTVSIGVATYPHHGVMATDLVRRADTAMYQAKHAGRNLCISAGLEN